MSEAGSVVSGESSSSEVWYERGNVEKVYEGQDKHGCEFIRICPNVDLVAVGDAHHVRLLVSY